MDDLVRHTVERRAAEAVIWGMPAVNFDLLYQAMVRTKGSLDLYIQAASPGPGKEANGLPVAKVPFTLLMRLYSPKSEILDGTWTPSVVKPVN